jgi:transcriptional regulator with XRE-family HTH domain
MSEQGSTSAGIAGGPSVAEFGETFESRPIGEYLRRQRILRGMSAEELASITRIPLRSLERLESGQFDGETDGFVRGFVRTVANALGLDAEDAVSRMLREPVPGARERRTPRRSAKQAFAGVVLLLLLVLSFFVLRSGWHLLLGTASTPASRQVVLWHDPVRALAEARGVEFDRIGEIDPGIGADITNITNTAEIESADPVPSSPRASAED